MFTVLDSSGIFAVRCVDSSDKKFGRETTNCHSILVPSYKPNLLVDGGPVKKKEKKR